MSTYTQAGRPLAVRTSLGPDALLLTSVEGHEEVSGLFRFRLELLADRRTPIAFEEVLGKQATVEIEMGADGTRWIDGIVCRLSQGGRDATFTHLEAELVPRLWLLTRKVQSRIFQRMTVPEILDAVLAGIPHRLDVVGAWEPRDYCTQYRESDFAFVSRLMEEEGIRYYFVHSDGAHEMVVTDAPLEHPPVPGPEEVAYEELVGAGHADEMRVTSWTKSQLVRSTLTTLRDHSFELPGQSLEAQQATVASVPVGEVSHELKVVPEELEVYDFPGGYAQRFDGSTQGGSACPAELKKVFPDGLRTVRVRMEQEEAAAFEVRGVSTCRHFTPGHQFVFSRHFDANGTYVLTRVEHRARLGADYRTGDEAAFSYENSFSALPASLPLRPPRATPRPTISGTQTATVVTPPGEELWCDRYGRVKVQFHWDREGTRDLDSSCWVRVAQTWAGRSWGAFFWPRAGNEVVVAFEEGDPDQPVVVGSVYNAENMPPFELPLRKELAGVKSASLRGFANQHFNGLVFVDTKGTEHLAIHSQRTMTFNSELDKSFHSGRNKHEAVSNFSTQTIGSLPGGGGRGGGPDDETDKRLDALEGNTAYHPWGTVKPAGVPGLNSVMVYGENLSAVLGVNHQLTVGSNLQFCFNPTAIAKACGLKPASIVEAFAGTGAGGNLQMTIGTNTNFVVGRNYNIYYEEEKKSDMSKHVATKILCGILAAAATIWIVAYACLPWDWARAVLVVLAESLFGLILLTLMTIEAGLLESQGKWDRTIEDYFGGTVDPTSDVWDWKTVTAGVAEGLVLLVLAYAPVLGGGIYTAATS
jgi:type VI secretion system secreted protein VgrG